MNNISQWFQNQLQASADGFIWGVGQIPEERRTLQPPHANLGEWTVARHVFHMHFYEQNYALPGMFQWLGEPRFHDDMDEDAAWATNQDGIETLLLKFKNIRANQIDLLQKFNDELWRSTRDTVWGQPTLLWVVSKTYQHTAEHTNDVMRIGLFWDFFVGRTQE